MARRGLGGRILDLIGDLLTAKEMWFGIPTALALISGALAFAWDWFSVQATLIQFTSASSAFLFLALGTTAAARRVAQWRALKVTLSVRRVEVTVHMSSARSTAAVIWLHGLVITSQARQPLSLELEGVWDLPGGRRWSRKGRWETHQTVLNEQQPTFRDDDVRFLFPYHDANDMGLTEDDVRAARTTVIIRDLVSGRERRLEVKHGEAIP